MIEMTEAHKIGLMLYTSESTLGDRPLMNLELHPVEIRADGEIRNPSTGGYDCSPLGDLQISAQLDHVASGGEPYGWHVEYHNVYSLRLDRAELAVKTLRKIDRALKKSDERDGYPETFAAYVLRVAGAIGTTRFGWARMSTGTYATGDYWWTDASGLTSEIRRRVSDFNRAADPAQSF